MAQPPPLGALVAPAAEPAAEEGVAEQKNAAVRSYLNATIAPALLNGLVEMGKEECACTTARARARALLTQWVRARAVAQA